jgi:hypothetical protein
MLDIKKIDRTDPTAIENVEKKKHEYKLLGSFSRTKGMRLYEYNSRADTLKEVVVNYSDTRHLIRLDKHTFTSIDLIAEKATVDSRNDYFEAVRLESAKVRLKKFKAGKIKELCNLKPARNGTIKLF